MNEAGNSLLGTAAIPKATPIFVTIACHNSVNDFLYGVELRLNQHQMLFPECCMIKIEYLSDSAKSHALKFRAAPESDFDVGTGLACNLVQFGAVHHQSGPSVSPRPIRTLLVHDCHSPHVALYSVFLIEVDKFVSGLLIGLDVVKAGMKPHWQQVRWGYCRRKL
jgi:hypothetical protein